MSLMSRIASLFRLALLPPGAAPGRATPRRRWTRVVDARGQYLHRFLDEGDNILWLPGDYIPKCQDGDAS